MRAAWHASLLVTMVACGPSGVATYEGFATNACSALVVLSRTVESGGFPGGSEPTRALDEAVRSANVERAEQLAAGILTELERGREYAAAAAAWQPGATAMSHLDRIFLAHEAVIRAKVQRAARDPSAPDASEVFRAAGGAAASEALERAAEAVRRARPPDVAAYQCDDGRMSW